jgi:hypothetical protein
MWMGAQQRVRMVQWIAGYGNEKRCLEKSPFLTHSRVSVTKMACEKTGSECVDWMKCVRGEPKHMGVILVKDSFQMGRLMDEADKVAMWSEEVNPVGFPSPSHGPCPT